MIELLKSYGVEPDSNGNYNFSQHEDVAEISSKVNEILMTENHISIQITEQNLYVKISRGLSLQYAELLKNVLS